MVTDPALRAYLIYFKMMTNMLLLSFAKDVSGLGYFVSKQSKFGSH